LKARKKWIWLALDASTREIVGVFVGSRGKAGAKGLWRSLPAVYRQCAVLYTDFWKAYAEVFPTKRHKSVGKSSGKTNGVERFNCTLRQRTGPEGAALSKTTGFTPRPPHPVVL
jgi:insertion element IS1 protein InsB